MKDLERQFVENVEWFHHVHSLHYQLIEFVPIEISLNHYLQFVERLVIIDCIVVWIHLRITWIKFEFFVRDINDEDHRWVNIDNKEQLNFVEEKDLRK